MGQLILSESGTSVPVKPCFVAILNDVIDIIKQS